MRASGAPEEVIADAQAQADRDKAIIDFEIWADCWKAFEFFRGLAGDWNYAVGMTAVRVGIPSNRVESAMNLLSVAPRKRKPLYEDVKLMERQVRAVDGEKAEKRESK